MKAENINMNIIDYIKEREKDILAIMDSKHPRKIIVAGPGTGKSYLFTELAKQKRNQGKTKFLAITFIGKLSDALADDLCGLVETATMHSFARRFVLEQCPGWSYYPKISKIIEEDLKAGGITKFEVGDENYVNKTKYYKAFGDDDVVYYAVQICKKDESKIPIFDLILVDEYQDFNSIESEFVDLLAKKNDTVVVGDDDQALYGFKGSSPAFIREKFHDSNTEWESKTLRFCSRCTEVIINFFHDIVKKYNLNDQIEPDIKRKRIEKQFICYMPEGDRDSKIHDSKANPKIHLIKNCPPDMIAYKIWKELESVVSTQNIKDVLVIGEGQSCKTILKKVAQHLKGRGFKNVDYQSNYGILQLRHDIIDAYEFIVRNEESLLGWRILNNPSNSERKQHLRQAKDLGCLINGAPSEIQKIKDGDIFRLEAFIEGFGSDQSENGTRQQQNEIIRRKLFIRELKETNPPLPRPLCNLGITVCNILNSKGLGADVVFLIGFDNGKFPSKKNPTEGEIYQMLVSITRAKKRLYLVNTVGKSVSSFLENLSQDFLAVEEVKV